MVRQGRKEEFEAFNTQGEIPNPQAIETMLQSQLNWKQRYQDKQGILWLFYQKLLQLRSKTPALASLGKRKLEVKVIHPQKALRLKRSYGMN